MRITSTAAALLALAPLALLVSCRGQDNTGPAPSASAQAVYHNPGAKLRLTYPASWTRREFGQQGTRALVAFLSPPDDKGERQHLAFDVRKLSQDQPITIETLSESAITEAREVFPRFELISSEKTTFGGAEAARITYHAGTERGAARIMQVLAIANGNAWSATYTARTEASFARSLPQVEQILASVKIE